MSHKAQIKAEPGRIVPQTPQDELSVGMLIGRARTTMLTNLDAELEPLGVTGTQYGVLKHIADSSAGTAADLCRINHYDTGSMTRLLDKLEEKGLLRRERCAQDRRVVYLKLTSAGRALLPKLREVGIRVINRQLAGFSAAEVDDLKRYLNRMIENGQSVHHEA
jgi:DNA-binding MarR family transcriptional regulator